MGHSYKAVGWNRQKRIYDLTLWGGIVLYLGLFIGLGAAFNQSITIETLLIRGLATAAFLLLHIILIIGPLCRIDERFLPLLYNRRHMGVSMCLLALAHGGFSMVQFHALGDVNPLVSLFTSNTHFGSVANFPFQPLGFFALLILLLMAATSHDYWLSALTPPVWKGLHMMVYIAYGLIVFHVAFGILQAETSPVLVVLMSVGLVTVLGLHLVAAFKEKNADQKENLPEQDGYVDVCGVDDIEENKARIVLIAGDRVAIFKYDGKVSAISNACQHQNGPLGEGQIIDGFVTCPWHGYQYCPHNGQSPPPFTEKVPTFNVKVKSGRIWVASKPNPAGTHVEPALINS
ncbi:MAG: Rieske (2Fe-2S) protein [Rhodothermaceae bacterium]|nr:Rieske (2Fe-2S) protein [Rhodothermaceae bacterium]